jgi:hypothetical protein
VPRARRSSGGIAAQFRELDFIERQRRRSMKAPPALPDLVTARLPASKEVVDVLRDRAGDNHRFQFGERGGRQHRITDGAQNSSSPRGGEHPRHAVRSATKRR